MAIKPILFNKQISTEMVRAILDGRKATLFRQKSFQAGIEICLNIRLLP